MCRKPCSQVSRQCGLPVTCFRQLSSQACQSEVVRTRDSMFTWTNTCVAGLITLEPYLARALLPQGCHLWVSAPTLVSLYLGLSVIILTTFQSSLILCRFISALIQTRYIWHRSMYEYIFTATPTAGTCYYITCLHYSAFELVFRWFLSIPHYKVMEKGLCMFLLWFIMHQYTHLEFTKILSPDCTTSTGEKLTHGHKAQKISTKRLAQISKKNYYSY